MKKLERAGKQETVMRPCVCAGCAGGGARSRPICVCMNVCVMHCHSMQSYISVIHIDCMSVKSWFSHPTCRPGRGSGCTVAYGQYGTQAPFSLDFPYRRKYFYVCRNRITWCELREAERSGTQQQRVECCVGEYYYSEEAPLTFCRRSLRSSFIPAQTHFICWKSARKKAPKNCLIFLSCFNSFRKDEYIFAFLTVLL